MTKASHFTIHSCKFRQLHDFTGEVVMSHLHEYHPPTHDVTRHAESRPKRVTSHYPEICDVLGVKPRTVNDNARRAAVVCTCTCDATHTHYTSQGGCRLCHPSGSARTSVTPCRRRAALSQIHKHHVSQAASAPAVSLTTH